MIMFYVFFSWNSSCSVHTILYLKSQNKLQNDNFSISIELKILKITTIGCTYPDSKFPHLIEKVDSDVLKDKLKINFIIKSYF